jgi:hypothetical protein
MPVRMLACEGCPRRSNRGRRHDRLAEQHRGGIGSGRAHSGAVPIGRSGKGGQRLGGRVHLVRRPHELSGDEQAAVGALVGGLIGLGAAGEEGFELGAERGAEAVAERGGVFSEEEAWDVLEEIPPGSAGLLVLLEHRWAIGLRDAIARAGGFRLASEFISPLDLVAIGLVEAEEAEALASAQGDAL